MAYHLKDGYTENPGPEYFVDSPTHDTGIVYQPDVYTLAEHIAELARVDTIVDLGCGWGDKLAAIHERHGDWHYVGIDFGPNIAHCTRNYPWGKWRDVSLEKRIRVPADAVIICADVIEHVANPTALLATLRHSQARAIVLSTPERDIQNGAEHNGPPLNPFHVREWNRAELCALLTGVGLIVRYAGLTRSCDRDDTPMATTVTILECPT